MKISDLEYLSNVSKSVNAKEAETIRGAFLFTLPRETFLFSRYLDNNDGGESSPPPIFSDPDAWKITANVSGEAYAFGTRTSSLARTRAWTWTF